MKTHDVGKGAGLCRVVRLLLVGKARIRGDTASRSAVAAAVVLRNLQSMIVSIVCTVVVRMT